MRIFDNYHLNINFAIQFRRGLLFSFELTWLFDRLRILSGSTSVYLSWFINMLTHLSQENTRRRMLMSVDRGRVHGAILKLNCLCEIGRSLRTYGLWTRWRDTRDRWENILANERTNADVTNQMTLTIQGRLR